MKVKNRIIGTKTYLWDINDRKKNEEDKKKLEEKLFQAQKMESIGRLAGGIAHDFNNILTGILGYAELLKLHFGDMDSSEGKAADVILKGANRATSLTQQLLGFARGGKYNPVPLNLNSMISEAVKSLDKVLDSDIDIKCYFCDNLNSVEVDKNQLDQVLTNFIFNAKDAMPNGGELSFTTENTFLNKENLSNFPDIRPGEYVKLDITDNGIGMSEDIKRNIFEPFFTIKGKGKGTGLGLAMVYGIIKNHKGHINVYSEPSVGTTFSIYIPVSEKKAAAKTEKNKITFGEETILVVDDVEPVRELAKTQLETLGYTVIIADNGSEAVRIYKKQKEEIKLILLDLIMPQMDEKDTYKELKLVNPNVKVLLMSGFSQNGKAEDLLKEGIAGFIQKPFLLHEVSKEINSVLKSN